MDRRKRPAVGPGEEGLDIHVLARAVRRRAQALPRASDREGAKLHSPLAGLGGKEGESSRALEVCLVQLQGHFRAGSGHSSGSKMRRRNAKTHDKRGLCFRREGETHEITARRARKLAKPRHAKPSAIIAQVDGSGTAVVKFPSVRTSKFV